MLFFQNHLNQEWNYHFGMQRLSIDQFKSLNTLTIKLEMDIIDIYDNGNNITKNNIIISHRSGAGHGCEAGDPPVAPAECRTSWLHRAACNRYGAGERCQQKNKNIDIPYFKDLIPSTENLAIFIWNRLKDAIDIECDLSIVLYETPRNFVEYSG